MEIKVFEFSGRIVAGANLYIGGSFYTYLLRDEPMSIDRRISRKVRLAVKRGVLEFVTT